MATKHCTVNECDRKHYSKGFCKKHYQKAKYNKKTDRVFFSPYLNFVNKVKYDAAIGCEVFTGNRNPSGYGKLGVMGEIQATHRFIYEQHYGHIPKGKYVLHTCNNGHLGCVSIEHLYLGTQQDNMRDLSKAGRGKSGSAKLNQEIADEIRREMKNMGVVYNPKKRLPKGMGSNLAKKYKVSNATISNIYLNKIYKERG